MSLRNMACIIKKEIKFYNSLNLSFLIKKRQSRFELATLSLGSLGGG